MIENVDTEPSLVALDDKLTNLDEEPGADENTTEFHDPAVAVDMKMAIELQEPSIPEKESEVHALSQDDKTSDTNSGVSGEANYDIDREVKCGVISGANSWVEPTQSLAVNQLMSQVLWLILKNRKLEKKWVMDH